MNGAMGAGSATYGATAKTTANGGFLSQFYGGEKITTGKKVKTSTVPVKSDPDSKIDSVNGVFDD